MIAFVDLLTEQERNDRADQAHALGAELHRRDCAGEPDSDPKYFGASLSLLEKTLDERRLANSAEIEKRKADRREAYLLLPHGQPVQLKA